MTWPGVGFVSVCASVCDMFCVCAAVAVPETKAMPTSAPMVSNACLEILASSSDKKEHILFLIFGNIYYNTATL